MRSCWAVLRAWRVLQEIASLSETKRSFREAKNVKTLTLIGMVFIPLAFICGLFRLFSMDDKFIPGLSEFWIYWVTAVPLIVVVFLGAAVANLGYDDDAGTWSFANI